MESNEQVPARTLDPLLNLPVPSSVSSLCFVSNCEEGIYSNDESDSSDEPEFRSLQLHRQTKSQKSTPNLSVLKNRYLASCHHNGEALLWDLSRQTNVAKIAGERGGPGLTVRRIDDSNQIMFQTRDDEGTVSIHSFDGSDFTVVRKYETYSRSFCQAAPCVGDSHLLALPSRQDSSVTVVDDRASNPVVTIPIQNHGMLTSLAMSTSGGSKRPILACGMENGSVILHDFSVVGSSSKLDHNFSKDPILAVDLAPSEVVSKTDSDVSTVVAIVGMAGDAAEVSELVESEQGRVALLKATHVRSASSWNFRIRARLSTCRVDGRSYGKPGISICRFRPQDGRVFAVGGWDHRVRLFERSKGKAMAILRGHSGSVGALDWDPTSSGLLASAGNEDTHIYLWKCFGKD